MVGETYNIGSQRERTVLSVARDILKLFDLPASKISHVRDRAFNDRRYFVCDKKLASLGAQFANPPSLLLGQCVKLVCCLACRHVVALLFPSFWLLADVCQRRALVVH